MHINTKNRNRKHTQPEELTGFDLEGHRISTVFVGDIADSSGVGADLETDPTLNTLLGLFLGCCVEDLAHKRTVSK